MKILLCNDDGFQAEGIVALYRALSQWAEVEVVAPEHNNSAKSNALTLHTPLYVYRAANGFRYVNGTPADCVHIALTGLLDYRPDLVVSGINNGANMGDDTIYSGTVGAAMEGYLMGLRAIAFSQVEKGWGHVHDAAQYASTLVRQLATPAGAATTRLAEGSDAPWLLNVNLPNLPLADLGPVHITRLGRRHAAQAVTQQINPRGDTMYWIGNAGAVKDAGPGTDFGVTAQNGVSLTPLQIDLTDHAALAGWQQWAKQLGPIEKVLAAQPGDGAPSLAPTHTVSDPAPLVEPRG